MLALSLCKQYLAGLNDSDLDKVLALFEPGAIVISPIFGTIPVEPFYRQAFASTNRSIARLLNVFESVNKTPSIALHFHYTWLPKEGMEIEFDCIDVFELATDRKKFAKLVTIFDPTLVRTRLSQMGLSFHANHTCEPAAK